MRRSWVAISLLLAAAGAGIGFYVIRSKNLKSAADDIRIVHAERQMIANVVNATGTVRLRVGSEVRVGSQLSGIVRKLNVTVGSHVRAGEVIAEIDDRTIRAKVADAEAQVNSDYASLEHARANAERAERLAAQGLIALQQQQDLEFALNEAQAKYEKSERDRDLAKVDLNYVQIRAPIAGTIASVSTQEGETVAASFTAPTFVTIIGDNALQLVAMVDETDIANVRRANPVTFTVDAFPSRDFHGLVESIAPKATIVSGVVNYEVTIGIGRAGQALKPDMTANVSIATARHEALLLPGAAVRHDGDQAFVFVLSKNGRERRPVVVGNEENGSVEIKKGLGTDDEVVLVPAESLNPKPRTSGGS